MPGVNCKGQHRTPMHGIAWPGASRPGWAGFQCTDGDGFAWDRTGRKEAGWIAEQWSDKAAGPKWIGEMRTASDGKGRIAYGWMELVRSAMPRTAGTAMQRDGFIRHGREWRTRTEKNSTAPRGQICRGRAGSRRKARKGFAPESKAWMAVERRGWKGRGEDPQERSE